MSLSTTTRKMSVSSASDSDNPPTPANEPSDSDTGTPENMARARKIIDSASSDDREKTPKADELNQADSISERRTSTPTTLPRFPHSVENLQALAQQPNEKQEGSGEFVCFIL